MHPGDAGQVEAWALYQDWADNAFLAPAAFVGRGTMRVKCTAAGFVVDVSKVPAGHKFYRANWSSPCRVVDVTGAEC
jgi:hypothetical protein